MERFVIYLDLPLEIIKKGYRHYYGENSKKPLKKDLAKWISTLAEADVLDCSSHDENDDDDDENE